MVERVLRDDAVRQGLAAFALLALTAVAGCSSSSISPFSGGGDAGACGSCPAGQFCLGTRCVAGKPCASDADCRDGDACHAGPHCDPPTSICIYTLLDKDGDGHPPPVCGGDDCDDSDPTRFPGAP